MDALAGFDDVGLPSRQYTCEDNELLNPKRPKSTLACYSKLSGRSILSEIELLRAFYDSNRHFAFAGFKSMPLRHESHEHFRLLTADPEVQVITIQREDLHSTVASFLAAARFGTWRREGEP